MAKTKTVPPSSEMLMASLTACKSAEACLRDASELLVRLGRPIAAQSCDKSRQQCLEVIEMIEGPPAPQPQAPKVEGEVPIPEV